MAQEQYQGESQDQVAQRRQAQQSEAQKEVALPSESSSEVASLVPVSVALYLACSKQSLKA